MVKTVIKALTIKKEFMEFESYEEIDRLFPGWIYIDENGFEWTIEEE